MTARLLRDYEGDELARDYQRIRPAYPDFVRETVMKYMLSQDPGGPRRQKFGKMLDVGCGGGKSTHMFAPHFDSILGLDISAAQIKVAKETNTSDNVEFQLVHDCRLPADDGTVDLVTYGTSAHYLDIAVLESECERVLRPSGCVALFWHHPAGIVLRGSPERHVNKEALKKFDKLFAERCNAMPYQRALFNKGYVQLFDKLENQTKCWVENLWEEERCKLADVRDFYHSLGVYRIHMATQPSQDPLKLLMRDIRDELGVGDGTKDDDLDVDFVYEYPTILFSKS